MSIFTTDSVTPAQQVAQRVKLDSENFFKSLVQFYNREYQAVWNNRTANPVDIVAAMGQDGVKAFTLSASLAAFINSIQANAVVATMPNAWTYAANQDGSVTLTPVNPPPAS